VRHSILFALPGILARVDQTRRSTLAVQSLLKLADDPSDTVRSALLEVLGEVIYTFRDDPGGPSQELIDLFVPEEKDWHKSEELMDFFDSSSSLDLPARSMLLGPSQPGGAIVGHLEGHGGANHLRSRFFKDPERPIVCAFNYPALTLVLGRERWLEIRDYYLHLTEDRTAKVRRTLAASLGEMANIIGPEQAGEDLAPVFWDAVRGLTKEEEDIRTKALEGLPKLLRSLNRAQQEEMAADLITIWENSSQYWRQRELFAGYLGDLVGLVGSRTDVIRGLMGRALRDEIAAVRDAAIGTVIALVSLPLNTPHVICSFPSTWISWVPNERTLVRRSLLWPRVTHIVVGQREYVHVSLRLF
jgi:serine/threonine-protein phosphatase 4 regulatory subunit 1